MSEIFLSYTFTDSLFLMTVIVQFQYVGDANLFEDEDSRVFYENLPDLKAFIPGVSTVTILDFGLM